MSKKLTSGNDALPPNQNPLESIVEIFGLLVKKST